MVLDHPASVFTGFKQRVHDKAISEFETTETPVASRLPRHATQTRDECSDSVLTS